MKPRSYLKQLLILPVLAGSLLGGATVHAQASPGMAGVQAAGGVAAGALSSAAMASLCAGVAASAAASPVGIAGAGMAATMLCSTSGIPLQMLMAGGMAALNAAMSQSGGGDKGGQQTPYTSGYNQVSGLPVISQPRTPDPSLNYSSVGSTIKPTVNAPVVQATRPPPPPSMYGPTVVEATPQVVRNFPTIAGTANTSGITGGVRLPNGQPALETGIRLGGFADGTMLASNGINVGSTNIATTVQQQQIDWFTLGFADGKDGRPRQLMQTKEEQVQYDSGYNMGLQNQVKPVVVS
jgi:hypothetical protein